MNYVDYEKTSIGDCVLEHYSGTHQRVCPADARVSGNDDLFDDSQFTDHADWHTADPMGGNYLQEADLLGSGQHRRSRIQAEVLVVSSGYPDNSPATLQVLPDSTGPTTLMSRIPRESSLIQV